MDDDEERRAKVRIQSALLKELETRNLSDYEDGNMYPSTEVHPIGHYIDDREEMMEQMFSVLNTDQIRRLLPYELKEMSIEELKADCLVHLLGMSKKRIFAILQGKELDSSSDSESDTSEVISIPDETPEENSKSSSSKGKVNEVQDLSSTNDKDKTSRKKEKRKKKQSKKKAKKKSKKSDSDKKSLSRRKIVNLRAELQLTKNRKESIEKDTIEISDSDEEDKIEESENEDVTIVETPNKGTSLLELLELEMRARAIKAALMLDKEGSINSILDMNNPVKIKQEKVEQVKKVDENKLKELKSKVCKQVDEDILLIEDVDIVELDNSDEEDAKNRDKITDSTETGKLTEDKSENEEVASNDDNNSNNEWSDRWLQSKDVQNVVSKNKMCANLRRRMRFARLMKRKELEEKSQDQTDVVEPNVNIEGSVQEYMALSSKSSSLEDEENNDNHQSGEDNSEKPVENETNFEKKTEELSSTENCGVSNQDVVNSSPILAGDVLNIAQDEVCHDHLLDPVIITDDISGQIEDTTK